MGNTFRAKYWDGLAGIAMILKGGFEVEGEGGGFRRAFCIDFNPALAGVAVKLSKQKTVEAALFIFPSLGGALQHTGR